jgi:predicted transposase YbfD/YdcC
MKCSSGGKIREIAGKTIEASNNLLEAKMQNDERRIMGGNLLHKVRIQREVEGQVHSSRH